MRKKKGLLINTIVGILALAAIVGGFSIGSRMNPSPQWLWVLIGFSALVELGVILAFIRFRYVWGVKPGSTIDKILSMK